MAGQASGQSTTSLVGREPELEAMGAFLSGNSTAACLVLSGPPGIGKTTLWRAGLETATQQGFEVLSTRASPGEAGLLFAALADLVERIDGRILASVPAPQMHALAVALLRSEPDAAAPEPFAISSGFLAAIRALAAQGRPLVAVDDVQWLDPSSAQSLLFLARRLSGLEVRFLLSRRSGEESDLERVLDPLGVERVEVGALSMGATSRLVAERYAMALPRRVLRQLFDASQGNPLLALELARTVREKGAPEIGSDLPAPRFVDDTFQARVRALSPAVGRALLAVALSSGLSPTELADVVGPSAVEEALDGGLIVVDRSRMHPAHPMLAAAARHLSTAADCRQLHRALAGAVDDVVLRARHLAIATTVPDREVAAIVASAARLAMERGAVLEAEELSAHALRITPSGAVEEVDRMFELARGHIAAGDLPGAARLLEERIARLPSGRPRALGHLLLGEASDGQREEQELDLAITEADGEPDVTAAALARKSILLSTFEVVRLAEAEALARRACTLAHGRDPERSGHLALAWALLMRGLPIERLEPKSQDEQSGVNLFDTTTERPVGIRLAFRGEVEAGEKVLRHLVDLSDQRGEPRSRIGMHIQLCEFALRAGDVRRANELLIELDQWSFIPELSVVRARLRAVVAATVGMPDEARRWAAAVRDRRADSHAPQWDRLETTRAVGLASLLEGDVGGAIESLTAVWDHCRREGVDEPGAFPVAGDLAEALVESHAVGEAADLIDALDDLATPQDHPWALATVMRGRAMIALAGGVADADAAEMLRQAGMRFAGLSLHFEQARCLLFLGRIQRRARQRAGARRALDDASGLFERLGCSGWAAKARDELGRVSGRRAVAEGGLTPSEQQVVEMASGGRSNKEIARALFVSVHTVEAHLSHAYAKLGVSSRAQLANRLARD